MRLILFAFLATLYCVTGSAIGSEPSPAREYVLDNGMKLIVREDHRAPVVVSQVWYKVGSSYEHSGITGISHALEHMMFKGTRKHPPGAFSRIIAEHGGRENAFTGRDYTAYFQQLEASRLAISFELEADRMRNLTLPADEFSREIEVIKEERRLRTEDDPQALAWEQLYAAAFTAAAYGNPIIGWMNDLDNMTIEDLRQWYRHWYAPDNATLVVVGDVVPDEVHRLARRHFGRLKADKEEANVKPRTEAAQAGERRVLVKAPARVPWVVMGYKVPTLLTATEDSEAYALEVLAGVLSGGSSARLQRHLVRDEGLAAEASAGYNLYARHDDLLILSGTPAGDTGAARLEEALRGQIARLREEVISDAELERIKAQVVASNVYERDSVFYQAMLIGMLETVSLDWRIADQYVERVQAVTAEQVREVARKYLTDDRLTVAVVEPLPDSAQAPAPRHPGRSGGHAH
jgi:zinc protease